MRDGLRFVSVATPRENRHCDLDVDTKRLASQNGQMTDGSRDMIDVQKLVSLFG